MYLREKNLVLGLIDSIYEAATYIGEVGVEASSGVILDCIEGMQVIDSMLSEEEQATESKRQYCELVMIFNGLIDIHTDFKGYVEGLKQEILRFKTIVEEEIEHKLKVVFLPYKASMWTSLESIWKAAQKDPKCEAIVMPIPYYELEHATQQLIYKYEGEIYPDYVPVVHFDAYSIEQEQPDIIFIHNPYDDKNTITSVQPRYYSKNLKNYTSMLVYVPYFIFGPMYRPTMPSAHIKVEAIKHVDKFIVQSERVKEIYEKYNSDKDKFIALGSPKTDAIIEGMKQKVEIPEVWREKINGKKVFLYNTHLSVIPKGREVAINNIRDTVYQVTSRQDCVLLWRPHPLSEIMIKDYAPEYLEEYLEIKNTVMNASNGIVDESGNYRVAFAISDALLTTHSSLIREYMVTGKPILIAGQKLDEVLYANSPVDLNCNYFSRDEEDKSVTPDFIEMVVRGEDPRYSERMHVIEKALLNCDGTCGEKVMEYIKQAVEVKDKER